MRASRLLPKRGEDVSQSYPVAVVVTMLSSPSFLRGTRAPEGRSAPQRRSGGWADRVRTCFWLEFATAPILPRLHDPAEPEPAGFLPLVARWAVEALR